MGVACGVSHFSHFAGARCDLCCPMFIRLIFAFPWINVFRSGMWVPFWNVCSQHGMWCGECLLVIVRRDVICQPTRLYRADTELTNLFANYLLLNIKSVTTELFYFFYYHNSLIVKRKLCHYAIMTICLTIIYKITLVLHYGYTNRIYYVRRPSKIQYDWHKLFFGLWIVVWLLWYSLRP